MIPTIGRIVHYTLTDYNASLANQRRTERGGNGNFLSAGQTFPMMIVRVWGSPAHEGTAVQGLVFLDGDDTMWVTSVVAGEGPGRYTWPEVTR